MDITGWIKSHPYETGGIVFGVGVLFLILRGSGGSSSGGSSNNAAAYFQAEEAQGVAGDELDAAEIAAQNQTAQTLLNDSAGIQNNTTWANASVTNTQAQYNAATAIAPYETEDSLIQELGAVSGQTQTNSKSSSGFFGIGGGSSSITKPTQSALDAASALDSLSIADLNGLIHNEGNG